MLILYESPRKLFKAGHVKKAKLARQLIEMSFQFWHFFLLHLWTNAHISLNHKMVQHQPASFMLTLVMGHEQNFCEMSINVISLVTICAKHDFRQLKFSPFFVILSEKLANLIVIAECKMGVNRNSMHRTNVKHDSVKC